MEIKRGAENGSNRANDLPVHYLRLLAPPLQLLSAAMWRIVQQGLVDHYGMLEEFVTMVTELVPELMSYSQRAQLTLGLRARLVLEMCRGEKPADMRAIQPHLDRIKAPASTAKDHHSTIDLVEESEVNFVELVHSLLEDPMERKYFFEEIFPVYFGPKYDAALEMLVWEFISRLEELLPVPDFTQLAALLGDAPSFLSDCLQSFFPPADMKALLEHHRNLGHFEEKDPRLLPMDDCILTSMSLPPGTKATTDATSYLPAHRDPKPSEHRADAPGGTSAVEMASRRPRDDGRKQNSSDETIDLTTSNDPEPEVSETNELNLSFRGGRALRKRKLSGGVEMPGKQRMEVSSFLESSMDDENSGESPLISIWGDYTEGHSATTSDPKVPWSEEETLHLLDIWGSDSIQRALKGCLKNRHIYVQIAQTLAERGFKRTVEQCQTRIKRLKKGYRQNKGTSRVEHTFYEHMKRVLGSPASSAAPDSAYDVDEVIDDEESHDGDEDLQFVGHTSQEMGTRNVPWTEPETLALINTWGQEKMQQEMRGTNRTMHMFPIISTKMASQGFSRTSEQCQTRLKRLKSSFRQCYENNMKGLEQVQCKFYNELAQFLLKERRSTPQPNETSDDNDSCSIQDVVSVVSLQDDRKKVPWADKETIILLELWGESQIQQSTKGFPPNVHIFSEISEKLSVHGFTRTAEQCHTRIKRLKTSYWQCRDSLSSSGTDKVNFKFFDLMEQILDKRPSTSVALVTDPIEISEDSNGDSVTETEGEVAISPWSDAETSALIDIWGEEEVQRSLTGFIPNGHVYAEISGRLQDLGFSKTPEQCHEKVKGLKSRFLQCYEEKKCGRRVDDKFYEQLEHVFGAEALSPDELDDSRDAGSADPLNVPWSERETETLVEIWAAADVQHSLKTCVRNGHVFVDIAERLAVAGYARSAEQCQARIKRLKKTYRRHCNSRRNGRSGAFRYFNLFAPVLGDNALYNDVDTSSSMTASLPNLEESYADVYEQPSTSHLLPDPSRKTPWSDRETHTLLEIWGEDNVQLTLRGCLKNRHVFEFISERMSNRGYARTTEQCYTRIKRLKYGFLHEKQDFKFFREMEEIFSRELKSDLVGIPAPDEPDDGAYEPIRGETRTFNFSRGLTTAKPPLPDFVVSPGSQWLSDNSKHPWSDGETEVLLSVWGSEDVQENLKSCTKNKHIFMQISDTLATQGYQRTPEQCQTRIKRLKYSFRQFLDGRKGDKQECKYFDQLVKIFGDKYVVSEPQPDEAADVVES
ncbi:uncharacterized protein zgc:113263 isoform X1 [Corythoichthys intestinalis]|uniref:uncharacterized protein zgc:113263 isoform X1 n=2 Tax=Corythoichthys intestinalis TaxID=161448 RepID=UPI0025A65DE5|nr:uncharacterized protein zgc:113263 isoform X1 [Corythoichthys intestinalis]